MERVIAIYPKRFVFWFPKKSYRGGNFYVKTIKNNLQWKFNLKHFNKEKDIFVIFSACFNATPKILNFLQSNGYKVYLMIHDTIKSIEEYASYSFKQLLKYKWDKICCYDKIMCRDYKLIYLTFPNRKIKVRRKKIKYDFGLKQSGQPLERVKTTLILLKRFDKFKINFCVRNDNFDKKDISNHLIKEIEQYNISNPVPSSKKICDENLLPYVGCYCHIMFSGNDYISTNVSFAIEANKKIITNSQAVKEMPYYDSRWIKVFDDFSKFSKKDADWLKDRTIKPNYKNKECMYGKYFADAVLKL